MALPISQGSGATIATDVISGAHFSYTKISTATSGATIGWSIDSSGYGEVAVKTAIPAGSNLIGNVGLKGNVTLDAGSKVALSGNVTISDSKGFIGLVTVGNTITTASSGNVTLDAGSKTAIVGNVTLSNSKNFIGLVTVGNTVDTTFSGNVTLDAGSNTGIVGNITLSDPKTFIGLTTTKISTVGSVVDSGNSRTAILTGDAVFTGTGVDLLGYTAVVCTLDSSHDSAASGMTFQFSTDDSNWDDVYSFTYVASEGSRRFQFPVTARYFRIVYTNGSTEQTHLRIQTLLHTGNQLTSIHRLADDTSPDRSATLTKTAVIAQAAGSGDFVAIQATAGGNLKTAIEEFDAALPAGANYIGLATVDIGTNNTVAITGNVTVDQVDLVTAVTDITNPVALKGNLTLSDPKGFIGLVTVVGSLAPAAGNVTLDSGSQTGIAGNVTIDSGVITTVTAVTDITNPVALKGNVTLSNSKGYIGLVTVGNVVDTTFSGNVTLDPGSQTGIVGNVTLSDSKGYIGLTTTTLGASPAYIGLVTIANTVGNATLNPSPNFIGIVTVANSVSFAGNVTLDAGSKTQVVGNVTLSDSKGYIGLVTVGNVVTNTLSGNVTIDSGVITTITNPVALKGNVTLSDPKGFIGLVTIVGSLSPAAGNVTLDAGSQTQIIGNVTVDQVDLVTAVTDITNPIAIKGNVTVEQGDDPWNVAAIGNVTLSDSKGFIGLVTVGNIVDTTFSGNITIDSGVITTVAAVTDITNPVALKGNLTLSDPKGFIGLVTVVGSLSPAAGNVTLDPGSQTQIIGNVTVDQVDVVTAVTDITNPIAIKGNMTLSDSKTFIGLVTVGNTVTTAITGNVTVDHVDVVTAVTDITNPIALKGNLTLSDAKTFIGLVTLGGGTAWEDPKGYIGLVTITGSLAPAAGNVTLDPGSQTGIVGNVTIDSIASTVNTAVIGNVTLSNSKNFIGLVTVGNTVTVDGSGVTQPVSFAGNVTIDSGTITAVTDITNPVALKGNLTLSDSKEFIGLVTIGGGTAWTDPKGYIGLVTITGSLAPAAGNVTLDPGSQTGIVGNITVDQVDLVTAVTDITNPVATKGNVTIDSGVITTVTAVTDITNPVALKGNVTLSNAKTYIGLVTTTPALAWPDPKGYIGLVTITGSLAAAAGNVTLDPGSQTQIVGNVTVDQVDVVTTVTAVTDITNPIALKGNVTISDSKGFIGLVTVGNTVSTTFSGNVTLDAGSQTGIIGNVTIDSIGSTVNTAVIGNITVDQVDLVTAVTDITNPIATKGNVTIDSGVITTVTAVTDITNPVAIKGNITLSDPKGFIGLVTIVGSLAPAAGNVTLDAGSLTGITGNVTIDSGVITTVTAVTDITNPVAATQSGAWALTGNVTVDQVDVVTAVTDITNPIALKGNVTISDSKGFIGLVTTIHAPISLHTTVQKVISATGQTAISVAVASNFFYVKDLFVSSLGRAEVQLEEGSTVMVPYAALATGSGYALHFGEDGIRAGTVNTAFNARLNGAATVSIMANMRWKTT